MDRAFITWDEDVIRLGEAALSRHSLLNGKGFFTILGAVLDEEADLWRGLRLLYIGQSGQNSLREVLIEGGEDFVKIQEALLDGEEPIVMLGEIKSSLGRMTSGFLDDVMTCLIYRHRFECNERVKMPYDGRKISVINRGDFLPLKPKCLLRPTSVGGDAESESDLTSENDL